MKAKNLCKQCVPNWVDFWDLHQIKDSSYTIVDERCDDCGKKLPLTCIANPRVASTGVDPSSNEIVEMHTIKKEEAKRPVATNKTERKKFSMKEHHKPKGNANPHLRRKT